MSAQPKFSAREERPAPEPEEKDTPSSDAEELAEQEEAVSNIRHLHAPKIPKFEKRPVDSMRGQIVSGSKLDDPSMPVVSIDDRVQVLSTMIVVGVKHEIDKDGNLVRVQILKPLSMDVVPFDPEDPSDDGVIRAPQR